MHGYRVVSRAGIVRVAGSDEPIGQVIIQYGRKTSDTEATVARVELFLLFGVLAGRAWRCSREWRSRAARCRRSPR